MASQKLLGIKWCHNVLNDDVRWTTKQLNFLAIAQVFCHSAQMPDETDLNKILTTGGDHRGTLILGR